MASNTQDPDLDVDGEDDEIDADLPQGGKLSGVLVDYRVTYKGHGKIFTGDIKSGKHMKHPRGRVVTGIDRTIAEDLQERGFAEIVEGSDAPAPKAEATAPAPAAPAAPKTEATKA